MHVLIHIFMILPSVLKHCMICILCMVGICLFVVGVRLPFSKYGAGVKFTSAPEQSTMQCQVVYENRNEYFYQSYVTQTWIQTSFHQKQFSPTLGLCAESLWNIWFTTPSIMSALSADFRKETDLELVMYIYSWCKSFLKDLPHNLQDTLFWY